MAGARLAGQRAVVEEVVPKISRRLTRAEQTARVRVARDELRHLRELSSTIDALETEIADLVDQVAPKLLAEPGFGPSTAGKLIEEIASAQRFVAWTPSVLSLQAAGIDWSS